MSASRNRCGCIIYTRFSPRPDASESESCEFQRAKCEEFAAQKGLEVRAVFDDPDRSGADEYREQLWNAVKALKKGDSFVVYKRDRIARDVYLACQVERMVERQGAKILAVSGDIEGDTPEAKMVRIVVAAMSEYERRLIRRRTSDAMRAYQKSGRRMSAKVPYGWRVDPSDPKRIVKDDTEQKGLAMMREMFDTGDSYGEIARQLDAVGVHQRNGRTWQKRTVWQILKHAGAKRD